MGRYLGNPQGSMKTPPMLGLHSSLMTKTAADIGIRRKIFPVSLSSLTPDRSQADFFVLFILIYDVGH